MASDQVHQTQHEQSLYPERTQSIPGITKQIEPSPYHDEYHIINELISAFVALNMVGRRHLFNKELNVYVGI